MKAIYALLIFLLVSRYKAEKCKGSTPTIPSDCYNREKNAGDVRCCYVYEKYTFIGSFVDQKSCFSLSQDEFDNINLMIKSLKQGVEKMGGKFEAYDIDCSSNYLYISLLLLIISKFFKF